jgi:predicted Zn-dependent peptidase
MNNFKIFKLDNGFRYLTIKNNSIQHCILLVLLGTGSVFETKTLSGISHYLEHLPFKGTKKFKETKDLSYKFDSLGTETNAFTDKEVTGYYIKVTKNFSINGLEI